MAKRRKRTKKGKSAKKVRGRSTAKLLRDVGVISLGFASLSTSRRGIKDASSTSKCRSEGERMKRRIRDMAKKGRDEVRSVIRKQTKAAFREFNIATKEDLEDLRARVRSSKRRRTATRRRASSASLRPAEVSTPERAV